MTQTPNHHTHVAFSKEGDVLIIQRGLDQPAFFIHREDLSVWLQEPTARLTMPIRAHLGLVLIATVFNAGASFSKLKTPQTLSYDRYRSPLRFDLPNGLCAVYINRNPWPCESEWIRKQGVDIIVTPMVIVRAQTDNGLFAEMLGASNDHYYARNTWPSRSNSTTAWPELAAAVRQALSKVGPNPASDPLPLTK
jgi:hypothetical protein